MDEDENENEGEDMEESDSEKELSFSSDSDEFEPVEPDSKADTTSKMAIWKVMRHKKSAAASS